MLLNPGRDPVTAAAIAEISTFDLLAGRMSEHLNEHAEQAAEMMAVMYLAGKVYAMTWAESPQSEPEFSALRESWRTGILEMMKSTTAPVAILDQGQTVEDAAAPEGDSSDPSTENVKKSVRKASN
jgi:hypothetical protein